jgi:hypothetical protein
MTSFHGQEKIDILLQKVNETVHNGPISIRAGITFVTLAVLVAAGYIYVHGSWPSYSPVSTKGQRSKAMKAAFEEFESRSGLTGNPDEMRVRALLNFVAPRIDIIAGFYGDFTGMAATLICCPFF